MTARNYIQSCQVCDKKYMPTLNSDGMPRKTKYYACSSRCRSYLSSIAAGRRSNSPIGRAPSSEKTYKKCRFCSEVFGPLLAGIARRRYYCSRACASKAKTHTKLPGKGWFRPTRPCKFCFKPVAICKEDKLFCSYSCHYSRIRMVGSEIKAIRAIGDKHRRRACEALAATVNPEAAALKRIAKKINLSTIQCLGCGSSHIRRYPYSRACSELCHIKTRQTTRKTYRNSEAGRSSRRACRARRRARMRNAKGEADYIDPIAVFERDRWVCHLCGIKTLKCLRGTIKDRAPELEHIISLADNGAHTWGNVACSCRKCNQAKGAASLGQLSFDIAVKVRRPPHPPKKP